MHARIEAKKAELAYSRIKGLVINARFKPGEQLHIAELAEQFDLSPTPIREALTRLLAEDLIAGVPNRGFFCKNLDVKELCALYEFAFVGLKHSLKAGLHVDRAAERFSGFRFPETVPGGTALAREQQCRVAAELIERLYTTIALLSGNPLIVSSVATFNERSHYIRLTNLGMDRHLEAACHEFDELAASLRSGRMKEAAGGLQRILKGKLARMPYLAKEGLARAYFQA